MARVPHLVPRRVIAKWETLVGGAIQAEEERTLHESHWNEYSSTPFVPHLVPRRVIAKWETLVGRAIEAEEERTLHKSHWNEYSSTPFVPQIVHQQEENIDNILQTAHSVQDQYPQVARILYEYSDDLSRALDPRSESRGVLQFKAALLSVLKQRRGLETDRSQDVYIIEGFYKDLKRKLDQLEDENSLRQQSQYDQTLPEGWAELKGNIDSMLQTALCAYAEVARFSMGEKHLVFQPEELKFALIYAGGERSSSPVKLTNPTDLPVGFVVQETDTDNYDAKPSRGIVPPFGTRRINVTARGLPLVEQREGEIPVLTFCVPPDCGEKDIAQVFLEKYYHPPLRHHAISRVAICERVIRVRWVSSRIEIIPILMNKAAEEVSQQNYGLALETLREAIELHSDGFTLLFRALVNHLLGQKEGVKRDLQEAERLLSIFELAEGTGEHFTPSVAYCIISDIVGVPTYTTEKICGKQMIVNWSVAITENQRLDVEVHLTPSNMFRPDGNVEVIVIVDSIRFEVVRSHTTDSYPDHFLQSVKIVARPTGKWSESFSKGFGLIKCSPGNELNPLFVQQARSRGYTLGVNLGASIPSAGLQWNGNNTSGTTFPAFGFKKSTRDGHAYVCEYELRTFEDGSSTQNLRGRRFYTNPKIPEAVRGEVNYPHLGKDATFAGTWMVSEAIAMELRNEFEFTISLEAKLPAVWKCKKSSPTHLFKPPEPVLEVRRVETRRICVFAIARLKSFIGKST